jgi:hypothetical protein
MLEMPTDHILSLLIEERNKIDRAIAALQGTPRATTPRKTKTLAAETTVSTKDTRKRPRWTGAMRRAASERAKTAYAERMKKTGKKR